MKNEPSLQDLGEFGLIHRIQAILGPASENVIIGLGDDAAIVPASSSPTVITTDAMVGDIHFRSEWTSPEDLAHKALASNVSDLAAKCAEPRFGVISLGLPPDTPVSWVETFYSALKRSGAKWGIEIIGGDTVRSPNLFVSITAHGRLMTPKPVTIHSAQPGDDLLITGTLGDATAGLEILENKDRREPSSESHSFLIERFLQPTPRIREALVLAETVTPSSMTDISDGLARDLPKLCRASQVGAEIDVSCLPRSKALESFASDALEYALRGGEDYELLLTLPHSETERLLNTWDSELCPISVIGRIQSAESGIHIQGWDGPLNPGFDHFTESSK